MTREFLLGEADPNPVNPQADCTSRKCRVAESLVLSAMVKGNRSGMVSRKE